MVKYSDVSRTDARIVLNKYVEGNPTFEALLGKYRGEWAQATRYEVNDMVRNSEDDHIWICTTTHTSGLSFDATKFGMLLGLSPFQAIVDSITEELNSLESSILSAETTRTNLDAAVSAVTATEAAIVTQVVALAIEELSTEIVVRPSSLANAAVEDLANAVIMIDNSVWDAPLQTDLTGLLDFLGAGIEEAEVDGNAYGRKDGGWIEVSEVGHQHLLAELADFSFGSPSDGDVIVWNGIDEVFELSPSAGVDTIAGLTDVDLTGLANNYILRYKTADSTWHVEAVPASTVQTTIPYGTTITGPATEAFTSAYSGKLTLVDLSAGDVTITFNDSVSTPAGEFIQAYFRTINQSGTFKLKFQSADIDPPDVGTLDTNKKSTGDNTIIIAGPFGDMDTVTVTAGDDKAVLFVLTANPSNLSSAINAQKIEIAGTEYDWQYSAVSIVNNVPYVWARVHVLGDLGSDTAYTYRPKFEDLGTLDTNCCSYLLHAIPLSKIDQATPVDGTPNIYQVATGVTATTITQNANGPGRKIVYTLSRRNNSGNTAMTITNSSATLLGETSTSAATNSGQMRSIVAHEDGVVGENNVTLSLNVTFPFAVAAFALNPASGSGGMTLLPSRDEVPEITENNKTVGVGYDANNTRVMLDF